MATFAESFSPRASSVTQAAEPTVYDRLGIGINGYGNFGSLGGLDEGSSTELVKHYRLWNYVAISRICYKISESFPNVSRIVTDDSDRRQRLTVEQRQHIRQRYGSVIQKHEELEPVGENNPLLRLLHTVNPQDWWQTFIYETVMFWQLTGEFYWWLIPNGVGLPSEMWVLPSQWVQPKYNDDGALVGYQVTPDGDVRRKSLIPPEQIITGKHKSPSGKLQAHSPTAAGSEWIDNSESVEKARWHTFRNGPLPSVSIELDPERYSKPDPEVLRAVKDRFVARYGGTARAGEPIIAPPGMTVKPFSMKPAEMDFPATIDQVRDQVLALHGVPKVIAGITTDVNRATIYGANLIFCESTINPLLTMLAGVMTEKLAPQFGEGLRIWFDDARPDDAEAEREETRLDWTLGAITPNERRMERGREPLEDRAADSAYIGLAIQPVGGTQLEDEISDDVAYDNPAGDEVDDADEAIEEEAEDNQYLAARFNLTSRNGARSNGKEEGSHEHDRRRNGRSNGEAVKAKEDAARWDDPQGVARISGEAGRGGVSLAAPAIITPRAVWQGKRDMALVKAWHSARMVQERALTQGFEKYQAAVLKRAEPLIDDIDPIMAIESADRLVGQDTLALWEQYVSPQLISALLAGATFEMRWLGIELPKEQDLLAASVSGIMQKGPDREEFFDKYPGTPNIFVEMPPEVQADIIAYLKQREIKSWQEVSETTRRRIEKRIARALREGWSQRELVKEVKFMLRVQAYTGQAATIARTEATAAMNSSAQTIRGVNGIGLKVWIATQDKRVRSDPMGFDHLSPMNLPPTPNVEPFLVSSEPLMFPGDPAGSAGNTINCRCVASGYVEL
jgi:HK97 family phage portal protein